MKKALIVVDMQNDFLTGSLANPAAITIIPKIKALIDSSEYDWVVFIQDTHSDNYLSTAKGKVLPIVHCLVIKEGWELANEFIPVFDSGIKVSRVFKTHFGTLRLAEHLEGLDLIDEVTFCRTCTDICVISNVFILKTMRPEWVINGKADCCAGLTKAKHEAALEVMQSYQINII